MAKLKKEQQQVIALSAVLVIIGGVLVYFNWDKILPRPSGTETAAGAPTRLALPGAYGLCDDDKTVCSSNQDCQNVPGSKQCTDPIFKRSDFRSLKAYGDVPVRALSGSGSPDPFVSAQER